jgi:hypothetical protein
MNSRVSYVFMLLLLFMFWHNFIFLTRGPGAAWLNYFAFCCSAFSYLSMDKFVSNRRNPRDYAAFAKYLLFSYNWLFTRDFVMWWYNTEEWSFLSKTYFSNWTARL